MFVLIFDIACIITETIESRDQDYEIFVID